VNLARGLSRGQYATDIKITCAPARVVPTTEDSVIRALLAASLVAGAVQAQAPAAAPPKPPEIYFRSPADGATVEGTFAIAFGLKNYGVAPATVNIPGTGHFHVIINKDAPAVGAVIPPTDSVYKHFGNGAIETTLTLPPGTYTIRAVLGDFEHKVISGLVSKPIKVTVKK
jgi:hypothetical protein